VKGFIDDIEDLTEDNSDFRRVLYTGKHLQLVLMSLKPGEEIGEEVHKISSSGLKKGKAKSGSMAK
jgi:mannose-6-phosphate isomerase-like protein (cupin superfamily)